jgi:hypothetical protein
VGRRGLLPGAWSPASTLEAAPFRKCVKLDSKTELASAACMCEGCRPLTASVDLYLPLPLTSAEEDCYEWALIIASQTTALVSPFPPSHPASK